MSLQCVGLLVCLLVCVIVCKGLEVTIDRTPGSQYCAQLRCDQTVSQTDERISYLAELSIYNLTLEDSRVKLASVSVFDSDLYIHPSKVEVINGSGSITRSQGQLALSFQDVTDCLRGSFLCELDFFNVSGQPDVLRESISLEESSSCTSLEDQLKSLSASVQNLTSNTQTALANLTEENTILEGKVTQLTQNNNVLEEKVTQLTQNNTILQGNVAQLAQNNSVLEGKVTQLTTNSTNLEGKVTQLTDQNLILQSTLDNVVQRLNLLESQRNSSNNKPQDTYLTCYKGMSYNNTRQEFQLWGHIPALCDTETDGGGWVIIQRRTRGDVDFYRNWTDYKNGFGTPATDFWIGLDVIHNLTLQGYTELRFDLQYDNQTYFAHYSNFTVADELSRYYMNVSSDYTGTAGDSFTYHNGQNFSTYDRNNHPSDQTVANCAEKYQGAWWYNACYKSNLNGRWAVNDATGITWNHIANGRSIDSAEVKVRQV